MLMVRKLLYDCLKENYYVGSICLIDFYLRDYKFNKEIGFDDCFKIQSLIKDNVINGIYEFEIKDTTIGNKKIKIICTSYCGYIEEYLANNEYGDKTKLIKNNDETIVIELISFDWDHIDTKTYYSTKTHFDYNGLRYILYFVYYEYLRKTNPNHIFVQFVDYLSRIHLYDPRLDKHIKLDDYIESLKEIEQKEINENLFFEIRETQMALAANTNYHLF